MATNDKDEEIVQLNQSIQQISNIESKSAKSACNRTELVARLSPFDRKSMLDEIAKLKSENAQLRQQLAEQESGLKMNPAQDESMRQEMKKALMIHQANQKLQEKVKQLEKNQSSEQQDNFEQIERANNQIEELRLQLTTKNEQYQKIQQ